MNTIRVAKLYDNAILPNRKNPTDAGMDLYAWFDDYHRMAIIHPHSFTIIHTGISIEIPKVETFRGGSGGIVEQVATVKSNIEVFTDGTVGIPSNLEPHEGITWPIEDRKS